MNMQWFLFGIEGDVRMAGRVGMSEFLRMKCEWYFKELDVDFLFCECKIRTMRSDLIFKLSGWVDVLTGLYAFGNTWNL